MNPSTNRTIAAWAVVVGVAMALTACAPIGLPQPAAVAPTKPAPMTTQAYPAPSDSSEVGATAQPPEPGPTPIPPSQYFTGSQVVNDDLGFYSVTVPENWVAELIAGGYVRMADYDVAKLEPPVEGSLVVRIVVVTYPEGLDLKGVLVHEIELMRTNPDGLLDPTRMASMEVAKAVEMKFAGLDGYGYRVSSPDILSFVSAIDKEHYLLVRTVNTWGKDTPSLKALDTLVISLR